MLLWIRPLIGRRIRIGRRPHVNQPLLGKFANASKDPLVPRLLYA